MRKELTLAAALLALLFSFAGAFVAPASAQSAGGDADAATYDSVADESFVIFQNEAGETVCRPATPAERERIRNVSGTHVIYHGAPRRKVIDGGGEYLMQNSVEDSSGLALQASAGLTIVLNGTAQLESFPEAKNAFILAANRWESLISTPITITLNVDYGPTFFGDEYDSTTILGQTGSFVIKSGGQDPTLSQVRTRLLNTASGSNETALYNALPSSALPIEYNDAASTVSNVRVNTAQARALGFLSGASTDAQIGFNSNFGSGSNTGQFDFDPSNGITTNFTDFDAVVVHEIGHALGFTSNNGGSTVTSVSIWDLFRFKARTANAGNFDSAPRIMTKGGEQVMFGNFTSTFAAQELNVSTGGPNPPQSDTDDGRQSSHWKDDQLFSNRPYIGIMDPTLSRGLRRTISENDVRALELIGYTTAFNPTRPANDNFASAGVISGATGAVTGTSLLATREAGEPGTQAGYTGDKSVWFNWTAPVTGTATFDTSGSAYDTTLGVYHGAAVNVLLSDGQSDDATGLTGGASRVTLSVTAGTVYRIDVDGWNGEYGNYQLNWSASGTTPTPTPTPTVSYSVSGRVQDAAGNGLAGVRVAIDGPNLVNTFPHLPVTTDAGGNFQFSLLTPGGNYTVRNDDSRYTFAPAAAVFNNIGANHTGVTFTASPLLASVTGRVVEGSSGLSGVLVGFYSNTTLLQQTTTGADGRWTFTGVPIGQGYNTYFVKSGYTFSPPGLLFLVNQAALDMGDVFATKGNPIDASDFFVAQHYRDFLGREPDASGLAFWTNNIESCGLDLPCRQVARINVSAAFFLSIEFQNTGYLVERMYKSAYGDRTEASTGLVVPVVTRQEFVQDTPLISQNVVVNFGNWQAQLDANKAAYALAFVQRTRFTAAFPASMTPAQFVAKLNQNTGGALPQARVDALAGELALNNTDAGRASVLRKVAESAELDAREKNRAYVLMQYFGYLRRNPSDAPEHDLNYAGWNFWLGKLNEFNGDAVRAEMVKAFLDSAEYRQRFGQ
ncbi:MAG TPA: NF038122 family metalloprotease [Pyrinomonadaceae bacterium]